MNQYKCKRCSKEYLKEGRGYNIDDYHHIVCQECERLFEGIFEKVVNDFISDDLPYEYQPIELCKNCICKNEE